MYEKLTKVTFPEFSGVNCNMLPFILGNKQSLPLEFQQYYSMIEACNIEPEMLGQVCYITVREGFIEKGQTQSTPGMHTEATKAPFGVYAWGGGVAWGCGSKGSQGRKEGVYVASTDGSMVVINTQIPAEYLGVRGEVSDIFTDVQKAEPSTLYWLTDRTPHKATPVANSGNRQFFRLVTKNIGAWYSLHNTKNPLVSLPQAVQVIETNKFKTA